MTYELIRVAVEGRVGVVTLHRPEAKNALSNALMAELGHALAEFEAAPGIGAVVITGGETVFAAGADVKEMEEAGYAEMLLADFPASPGTGWRQLAEMRKPVIAAVAGLALGGGCELALACDIVLAAETAVFGQPEIGLGTLPGAGGTQRLTHAVGKSKAMEMCLAGRHMEAPEAERLGLVSRVVPVAELHSAAMALAARIAAHSRPAVLLAKECVNAAFEMPLQQGLRTERRAFEASFATQDRREGMAAFRAKRKPEFKDR